MPIIIPIIIKDRKEKWGEFKLKWLSDSVLHVSLENRYFQVKFFRKNNTLKIDAISASRQSSSLRFRITCEKDEIFSIDIPRDMLDCKINGKDDEFIVLVDGEEVQCTTKSKKNSRKITLNLSAESQNIDILGTETLGISNIDTASKKHLVQFLKGSPQPKKNMIKPHNVKVRLYEGIEWINQDHGGHMVVSGTPKDGFDGFFHSALLMNGEKFGLAFQRKGTLKYFCKVHPWEIGIINIK